MRPNRHCNKMSRQIYLLVKPSQAIILRKRVHTRRRGESNIREISKRKVEGLVERGCWWWWCVASVAPLAGAARISSQARCTAELFAKRSVMQRPPTLGRGALARTPPEGKVERAAVERMRAPPPHAPHAAPVKCQCRVSVTSRTLVENAFLKYYAHSGIHFN